MSLLHNQLRWQHLLLLLPPQQGASQWCFSD
jgi:hypothetical protein